MHKIFVTLIALLGFVAVHAQSNSEEPRSLVVKTTDGNVVRFNLDEIELLTFDNNPAEETTTISLLNLSPEFLSISGLEENQTLNAGEEAVLTLTPGIILSPAFEAYHFEHIHVQINDRIIVPEVPADYTPTDVLKVPFTVPAGECNIVVCYSIQQQMTDSGYTMTLEANPHVRLYGVSPDCRYKYFDAYLLADEAYVITNVEYKMGDGAWTSVEESFGCSLTEDYEVPNLYHICIRPDYENVTGDVVLRVKGEQHQRYDISWINAESEYLNLENCTLPEMAIDGAIVTAVLDVNDDYYLNGASASDGSSVETLYRSYVRFIMPAKDVAINLDFKEKVPVSYVTSDHVKEAAIYNAPDIFYGIEVSSGIPGESVYVIASAESGYKPMYAVTDNEHQYSFTHYGYDMYVCEIPIPEDATSLSVSVKCDPAWTVSSQQVVVFDKGNLYAEGETVSFAMQVPAGKQIESVLAITAGGESLPVQLDIPYGSFTMPADNVEVAVTYEDLNSEDTVSVIAYYDEDQYRVFSSTNYDWDFTEGFNIDKGATFYLTVYDDYGENFYVGVKIGDEVTIYPAVEDEDSGEYTFRKALVANGNMVIKVGPTQSSVEF